MLGRNDLTSLVMLFMALIWIGISVWPGWTEGGSASFCGLMLITFLSLSWRKDSRWPSESRLDPEKIDLKFSNPWIVLRLQDFFGFLARLLRKPDPYFRRMVLSEEGGLEFHYIEPLAGIDVVDHLELGQVSSVHYWKETGTTYDPETNSQKKTESWRLAIKAGSVIHNIPNPPSSFWRNVPKKIERLCKILKLRLREREPIGTKFYDIYIKSVKDPENNDGDRDPISEDNWVGPDGTESGPGVPEDWYLTYDGPAPVVEGIYDLNYAVDRGNGAIPIEFYIKKYGVPEGFGETDQEKQWSGGQAWWKGSDSGVGDADEAVPPTLDRDFSDDPISVVGFFALSLFTVPGMVVFGGAGVGIMIFSIMNPNHEDGGLVGFVCMGIPCVFAGLISFLIWWSGVIKERLRVQHSKDRLVFQASFFGLGFLSEKRRLSEAVYIGTDKDGDHAIIYGRSSEGVEWELDMSGAVTELAESENPYDPPYKKWAREIAKAIGIELRAK